MLNTKYVIVKTKCKLSVFVKNTTNDHDGKRSDKLVAAEAPALLSSLQSAIHSDLTN